MGTHSDHTPIRYTAKVVLIKLEQSSNSKIVLENIDLLLGQEWLYLSMLHMSNPREKGGVVIGQHDPSVCKEVWYLMAKVVHIRLG